MINPSEVSYMHINTFEYNEINLLLHPTSARSHLHAPAPGPMALGLSACK